MIEYEKIIEEVRKDEKTLSDLVEKFSTSQEIPIGLGQILTKLLAVSDPLAINYICGNAESLSSIIKVVWVWAFEVGRRAGQLEALEELAQK